MRHLKILAAGTVMLAILCVFTVVVMAAMAVIAWLLYYHVWVYFVIAAVLLAYHLGLEFFNEYE